MEYKINVDGKTTLHTGSTTNGTQLQNAVLLGNWLAEEQNVRMWVLYQDSGHSPRLIDRHFGGTINLDGTRTITEILAHVNASALMSKRNQTNIVNELKKMGIRP